MTEVTNYSIPSLSKLYSREYDASMMEWRRLGSIDKAANVVASLAAGQDAQSVDEVLEVGCGTGDVLYQLAAKNIANRYVGIEIGDVRAQSAQAHNTYNDVQIHSYDGKTIPYPDEHFDLVYATHVLEHVIDERGFLGELRRASSRFVYVEVPL
ncbi:ubiquinone/menaquinone biosynthesis C-methylase UbiE [Bradyrhizobium sp. LB7.1]